MTLKTFSTQKLSLAIALALCTIAAAQAQVAPNAGQILRDLQAPPLANPPAIALPQTQPAPDAGTANQAKVLIKSINITGNQEIPTPELMALVADVVGTEQTLS